FIYRSPLNRDVKPASIGEFEPVKIGRMSIWPPVVLAPMAGVTNYPFRSICKEFGAGLYVSEMINARPLVDGRDKTLKLADFGPGELPRSLQLYGTDPYYVAEAVKRLVSEGRIDHLDMNFGCPVPKVTRKGGGAAIPVKPNLLRNIVRAAVSNAQSVPVTIKFRMGINADYLTFLNAGLGSFVILPMSSMGENRPIRRFSEKSSRSCSAMPPDSPIGSANVWRCFPSAATRRGTRRDSQ